MSRLIEGLESIKVLFDTKAKQSENAGYWKDFAGIIADAILTINEKTQRIENMETMIEDMEERIAIMTEGGYVPDWHFIKFREPTDEEKEYYKDEYGEYNEGDADNLLMLENAPADGEEVLLWTWCGFTVDTYDDGMFEGAGEVVEGMAWVYLPVPPKDGDAE